jgi:peptidoglycan/LPS O-acetylase OafA/YrhL
VSPLSTRAAYAIAILGGAALWVLAAIFGGRREAWDAQLYWAVAYPICVLLAGALGYACPTRAWRWGLTIMLVQALVLAFTAGDFSLLPLGLILSGVLALPLIGAAMLLARIRRRFSDS